MYAYIYIQLYKTEQNKKHAIKQMQKYVLKTI